MSTININTELLKKNNLFKRREDARDCTYHYLDNYVYRGTDLIDAEEFNNLVADSISRYEIAFLELQKENKQGVVEVKKTSKSELEVKVQKIGTYKLYSDPKAQFFYLQSPQSGLYNYKYDK
jgi:hypothetical protein